MPSSHTWPTVALLALSTATAQSPPHPTVRPASTKELTGIGVRAATVQAVPRLSIQGRSIRFAVVLEGKSRTIELRPHTLRAADFQLLVDDGKSVRSVPSGPAATYRGTILGSPTSRVAASLWNGQLTGQLHLDGQVWNVQPLARPNGLFAPGHHLVYRQNAVAQWQCGGGRTPPNPELKRPSGPRAQTSRTNVINECEIAFDCEHEFFRQNGSDVQRTRTAVEAIMNAVDFVYRRDVEVCHKITTILVRSTRVYSEGPNVGCISAPNLLSAMRSRWNTNHASIRRDITHMLSGGQPTNNIIGCAFVGVICNRGAGYGVSNARRAFGSTVSVVTHELGHNWSLGHCGDPTPCNSMCGGCLNFGPNDTAKIYRYKAGRTCLGVCSGCRYEAEYAYIGQACAGSGSGSGPGCFEANWNQPSRGIQFGPTEFAFAVNTGNQARSIESVEFFCGAASAVSVPVVVHDTTNSGAPGAVLATATMQVAGPLAAYRATFTSPVQLPANTNFFVGLKLPRTPAFTAPVANGSTIVQEYRRSSIIGGNWLKGAGWTFNYRVNCTSAGARPYLTSSAPILGSPHVLDIEKARPNAMCAVLRSARSLALDLSPLGAPGCTLGVDPLGLFLSQNATTSSSGTTSFSLPIPNNSSFCGATWFEQVVVQDPSINRLGWVLTRRGKPTVGN